MPPCRRPIRLFASLLAGVWALAVQATDESLFFTDLPTVYSPSRMSQPLAEAPGFVTVIDRETIRASGARQLSDLLRLVPGFQVTPRSIDTPRTAYHGIPDDDFSSRVQVLVDGRSQYSPLFLGGVNWNLMPVALEDIERIEVTRGSNVAAYGTNAFMGVVNIITLDPSQARGLSLAVQDGNQGVRDQYLRWGGNLGPAVMRLTYQRQQDDGLDFVPDPRADGEPDRVANGMDRQLFDFSAALPLNPRDELQIGLGQVQVDLDKGRIDQPLENPPRRIKEYSRYLQLRWHRTLAPDSELSLRYSRVEEGLDDRIRSRFTLGPSTLYIDADTGGRASHDELELQHGFSPGPATRVVWGLGSRRERTEAPVYYHGQGTVTRQVNRLFGHMEWRLHQDFLVNLGGSLDKDSLSRTEFSPRLAVSYHAAPGHTLRLGAARAYRIPSAYQQRGYLRYSAGNPGGDSYHLTEARSTGQVAPERLTSYELGYFGQLSGWRASLDVRAFREEIPNRIVKLSHPVPESTCNYYIAAFNLQGDCSDDDGIDRHVNGQRITIHGLEYQLRWQPRENTRIQIGQAYVRIRSRMLPVEHSRNDIYQRMDEHAPLSAPRLSSSLLLLQKLPLGLELSLAAYHVGKMRWTLNNPEGKPTLPGYRRVDLRLAYPFRIGANQAELSYTAQSVDSRHLEYRYSWEVRERHWIGLRLDL